MKDHQALPAILQAICGNVNYCGSSLRDEAKFFLLALEAAEHTALPKNPALCNDAGFFKKFIANLRTNYFLNEDAAMNSFNLLRKLVYAGTGGILPVDFVDNPGDEIYMLARRVKPSLTASV